MQSYDDLEQAISNRYPELSRRLQQIAHYALEHPNDMAFEKVATIAERAGVQPSTLIRFAQAFDYSGFSEMQLVFRARLMETTPSYAERLRRVRQQQSPVGSPDQILAHFITAGHHALDHLGQEIDPEAMQRACELLAGAQTIYIVAQRRSFPVAAYFAYALGHLGLHARLVDGMGGMAEQQAAAMRTDDVLIMVSFHPYAEETQQIARIARDRGVSAIAVTDSPLSPICQLGDPVFEVHDGEVQSFRSLTATMTLAISLVVALGQRLDLSLGGACGHTAETHDRDE